MANIAIKSINAEMKTAGLMRTDYYTRRQGRRIRLNNGRTAFECWGRELYFNTHRGEDARDRIVNAIPGILSAGWNVNVYISREANKVVVVHATEAEWKKVPRLDVQVH